MAITTERTTRRWLYEPTSAIWSESMGEHYRKDGHIPRQPGNNWRQPISYEIRAYAKPIKHRGCKAPMSSHQPRRPLPEKPDPRNGSKPLPFDIVCRKRIFSDHLR